MESVDRKKVGLLILAVWLLFHRKQIDAVLSQCRLGDLILDAVDYIWTLPQGLRFALVAASCLLLFVTSFKFLMKQREGDDKWLN
jgi:hypothetical protein